LPVRRSTPGKARISKGDRWNVSSTGWESRTNGYSVLVSSRGNAVFEDSRNPQMIETFPKIDTLLKAGADQVFQSADAEWVSSHGKMEYKQSSPAVESDAVGSWDD
jgi:hypothetical protein